MTTIPVYKICPKCHRKYLWNPGVGRTGCPHCDGIWRIETGLPGAVLKGTKSRKR